MRFSRVLLSGLLLSPLALAVQSANANTVEIRAMALEEQLSSELSKLGHQVEVISAEQIRRTGATDIAKALQTLVPSLYVSNKHGSFDYATISLQGSRTKDVLFLVDGVRINNRLFGSTSPLDTLPSHMVERVEVVKGGQSLFYGTQAVAGAINIITKAYTDEAKGSLSASMTSEVDQRGAAFDHTGTLPNGSRYVVSLSGDKADGFQPWSDTALQSDNSERKRGYEVFSGLFKLQHDFSDSRLTMSLQRNDAKLDFAQPYKNAETYNDRVETIATVKWNQSLSDALSFYLKAYYHDWDTEYTRIYNEDGQRVVKDDASFWGYTDKGVNAMLRYALTGNSEMIGGVDYQRYKGEDQVLLIKTRTEAAAAVFGQYRHRFAESSYAAFGVRHSDSELGGANTIWNASVRHEFNRNLYASAALGTSYALPDAYQLYSVDPEHPRGNEDLDGESSRNLNLAVGGTLVNGDLDWELSGYHRRVEDLIGRSSITVDGERVSTFVNSDDKVTGKGVGLSIDYRWTPALQARMSLDYNRLRNDGSNEQVDDVPESQAKLGLEYQFADQRWTLGTDAVYVGDTYRTLGGFDRQRYGDHWQMDVNGRWQFANGQSVALNIENLFDSNNVSRLDRGTRPEDGSSYLYENRVAPMNVKLSYRLEF